MTDHDAHVRPSGTSDATVAAVGQVTTALEWVERARGHLFEFHQQMGHADHALGEAADALEEAGHPDVATMVRSTVIGRNVLQGRWTFEIVEEFDDGYYAGFRAMEADVREALLSGRRHVFEAELKHSEQHNLPDTDPDHVGEVDAIGGKKADSPDPTPAPSQNRGQTASMEGHLADVGRQIDRARMGAQQDRVLHDDDNELSAGWDAEPA